MDKYKPKKPGNRIEFLEIVNEICEKKYENVSINLKIDGLEVEYELNNAEIKGKYEACFIPYPEF